MPREKSCVPLLLRTRRTVPSWRARRHLSTGKVALGKVLNEDRADWRDAYALFPGDVAYVWHAGVFAGEVASSLTASGFDIRSQIIWAKQHFVFGRGNYHWQHEPCWYAVRRRQRSRWRGDRTQSTVWHVANLNPHGGNREEKQTGHGTQKPVELVRRPILNHTKRGECVYDGFLGSGTTLAAAEWTERVCYGIELDPKYCDVIIQRWQSLTNKEATLDGDGSTLEHVSKNVNGNGSNFVKMPSGIQSACSRIARPSASGAPVQSATRLQKRSTGVRCSACSALTS